IGAGADQGAEVQVEVLAELQPAVGMRQRHRALDVVGDRLAGRVRQIVERQDDDMVAHADPAVLAPPAEEFQIRMAVLFRDRLAVFLVFFRHDPRLLKISGRKLGPRSRCARPGRSAYQRFVLTLCTWTCSPLPMLFLAMPMSWPYFQIVSPLLMSVSATLWPIGTSILDFSLNDELSWV